MCAAFAINKQTSANSFSDDHRLHDDNEERVRIVQSLIDALNLKENLIFMGHSRGGELALKLAAYNPVSHFFWPVLRLQDAELEVYFYRKVQPPLCS